MIRPTVNMTVKGGEIEVAALCDRASPRKTSNPPDQGKTMGGTGKKSKPPGGDENQSKKSPRKPLEDDDYEDGDIATPKRDRYGEDDEPL